MKIVPAKPEAYELFHEGVLALSQIEANGIRVDTAYLKRTAEATDKQLRHLERELRDAPEYTKWKKRFGDKAKLGAHSQLGTVVFDILGHPRKEIKGKRGQWDAESGSEIFEKDKNNEAAFENVNIPFVKNWFLWQKLLKVRNTYLKGLETEVEGEFLHPFFDLHIPVSYRGCSHSPNFQNYPSRNAATAEIIRSAFIPRDGHQMGENDFGGIEVRIGACYHLDPTMLQYISSGYDYHKEYASKCFKLDSKLVTSNIRYAGKNMFVFPQFYGSYYIDCCQHLWAFTERAKLEDGTSLRDHIKKQGIKELGDCDPRINKPRKGTMEKHVQQIGKDLWTLFHQFAQWKLDFVAQYKRRGFIELKTGFVCAGLYSKNDITNYPIQGAAFHCLLWVLIQLQKWLRKYKMKTKIVGQIHDSIISDIHPKEREDYFAKVKYLVEVALPKHWPWIITAMEIEAELSPPGMSWFHKEKVKI